MADYSLAFQTGLLYGIVFSLLFSALLLVMIRINPEMMLNDYPPEIKARYGPASEKTKKQRKPFVILFFLIVFGVPLLSILRLDQMIAGVPSFLEIFINLFTLFLVFNIVDLFILDWLIFCAITPRFIVLPGTEGMAAYKDYGFHFRGFLIGCVICIVSALVFASLASLVYFILGIL
jgi:tetrahydromethanopterin S-methyltransferase subunit B